MIDSSKLLSSMQETNSILKDALRPTNTQECLYYGYKLSNIDCDDIETTFRDICIGAERDDERAIKERVKIFLPDSGDEIDLEDVLRFSAKHCRGIYDRVGSEI